MVKLRKSKKLERVITFYITGKNFKSILKKIKSFPGREWIRGESQWGIRYNEINQSIIKNINNWPSSISRMKGIKIIAEIIDKKNAIDFPLVWR